MVSDKESESKESPKSQKKVFREQLVQGLIEYRSNNTGLLLSAFTAGLEIGFSLLLMGVLYTDLEPYLPESILHLFVSLGYPLGFIFVIIGRTQLFTEQTAQAILPFLNKNIGFSRLIGMWGIVLGGNLLGSLVFSSALIWIGPQMEVMSVEAFSYFSDKITQADSLVIFGSAILAGWMMGLLGWLLTTSRETFSRITIVFFITTIIGMAKLHHCIVGSVELFSSLLLGQVTFSETARVLIWSIFGNIVGGAFFVGIIKFSIIKLSEE